MRELLGSGRAVTFEGGPLLMLRSVEASLGQSREKLESNHRARREDAATAIEKIAEKSPDSLARDVLRNRAKMLRGENTWRGAVEDVLGAAMAYQVDDGDPARQSYQAAWRAVAALAVEA